MDEKWADQVEEAGLEWLRKNAQGAQVATIGWCMGGGQALQASLNDPDAVDATIVYYGMPVLDVSRLRVLHGPLLGIWANRDRSIPPEKVAQFDEALTEAGVNHEFHAYDADHAFANPSGGRYNGGATLAYTTGFLLGPAVGGFALPRGVGSGLWSWPPPVRSVSSYWGCPLSAWHV